MTQLAFAFGAGLLATVNPCGFAMLPAFLAFHLGEDDGEGAVGSALGRVGQGFAAGASVSLGFAGVYTAVGLLVSAGLRSFLHLVPWAAVVIGLALVAVGAASATGRHFGLPGASWLRPRQQRDHRRLVVFGAAYALASLSCTLAILLAVVAQALTTDNPLSLIAVFVAYGAGAATVLTALSVSTALARAGMARGVRRLLPVASRLGGVLLVASGAYLVAYWLPVLAGGRPNAALRGVADTASSRLTALLDAQRGTLGVLAVVLVVTGAGLALRARARRAPELHQARGRFRLR